MPLAAFSVVLRACLLSALGVGTIELVTGFFHESSGHYAASDLLLAFPAVLGLCATFGLVIGLGQGVIAAGFAARLDDPRRAGTMLARLRSEPTVDLDAAAVLISFVFSLLVEVVLVRGYLLGIGLQMASRKNTGLSAGIVAALGVVVLCLLGPAMFSASRLLARAVPRPRVLVLVGVAVLSLFGTTVLVLGTLDWRVMDFGPYRGLGLFIVLEVAHLWFWCGPGRRRFARLVSGKLPTTFLVALLLVTGGTLGWTTQVCPVSIRPPHDDLVLE